MLDESRKLGNFAHGFTYAGHPVTTAVAMETLRIYDEMDMLGHVRQVGPYLQQKLGALADHPMVGEVRGIGLLTGIELVADKTSRTLFDPKRQVGATVDKYARKHGLITRFVGDRIAFSPPLIITKAEIDEAVDKITLAINETWAEIRA
jgi:4-aminobutyrate--pyruvate transaminase